jgi:hypothetical protein
MQYTSRLIIRFIYQTNRYKNGDEMANYNAQTPLMKAKLKLAAHKRKLARLDRDRDAQQRVIDTQAALVAKMEKESNG